MSAAPTSRSARLRRTVAAGIAVLALSAPLLSPTPAEAWWHHGPYGGWHRGWHGGWRAGWHPGWGWRPGWGPGPCCVRGYGPVWRAPVVVAPAPPPVVLAPVAPVVVVP